MSKVVMRAKFRQKDFGNAGELTMEQMGELLREMREETAKRKKRAEESMRLYGESGGEGAAQLPFGQTGRRDALRDGHSQELADGHSRRISNAAARSGLV